MFKRNILLENKEVDEDLKSLLNEEFSYESFVSWAARKLKGYSVKEIDHLAKRVVNIDTHEEKTDVIERIREAVVSGKEKVKKQKEKLDNAENDSDKDLAKNEYNYMKEHLDILNVLLSKAQTFNIVSHLEGKKGEKDEKEKREVVIIGDR
jgi:hypothetical protein